MTRRSGAPRAGTFWAADMGRLLPGDRRARRAPDPSHRPGSRREPPSASAFGMPLIGISGSRVRAHQTPGNSRLRFAA